MSAHSSLETLAALAEGGLPDPAATRAREHMAGCRACASAYVDAVRYRAAWLARAEAFAPEAAEARNVQRAVRRALDPPSRRPPWLLAAASVAVVVACGFWVGRTLRSDSTRLDLPGDLRTATEAASSRGLVLPGGQRFAASPAQEMRSGVPDSTPGLENEVARLLAVYERGQPSADDAARVVTALLAVNDVAGARDYAREGLGRHPQNVKLLVLMAAVCDRSGDLAGAESNLREARAHAGADPTVALNLALVLRKRGEREESTRLLNLVAAGHARPLADRAAKELHAGS